MVPGTAAAERVVYINTDPVVLNNTGGQEPATNSYNTTGFSPGAIGGWPALTEAQQTELLYWLKEGSVPFDVIYTFERPMSGSYDMVVMGSAADNAARFPGLGCSAAVGLADCGDANAENISFLFWGCMNAADQADMHRVAFNIYAGLGFGWGLENLAVSGQIMGSYTSNALQFGNTCINIAGTQNCTGQHPGCADPQQNSSADLLARIGPRIDDGPPFVQITYPTDGEVVPPDILVTANVGDLYGGVEVSLEVVGAGMASIDQRPPYGWSLEGIPQGEWTIRVSATDADGNVVAEESTFCVDLPGCGDDAGADTTGGSSGDGGTTDGGDTTTSDGGSSSTGQDEPDPPAATTGPPAQNPTTFGGDTPETGCQCRADGHGGGGGPAALALLLVLGALTRRE